MNPMGIQHVSYILRRFRESVGKRDEITAIWMRGIVMWLRHSRDYSALVKLHEIPYTGTAPLSCSWDFHVFCSQ